MNNAKWPEMSQNRPIIIVGKGISGLILSILLKRQGVDHLILARPEKTGPPALGETLPPTTVVLLERLRMRSLFEACAQKTRGYHSLWGSNHLQHTSFAHQKPFNYGLKLNKGALLKQLEAEVADQICHVDRVKECHFTGDNVAIDTLIENKSVKFITPLVVDGTGRARAVLKQLEVTIHEFDQTLAFSCLLESPFPADLPHGILTETFELGWGIASSLNNRETVVTLYTEKELVAGLDLTHFESWQEILASTSRLRHFLQRAPQGPIKGYKANSSLAGQMAGGHWLAVGDAAMAFDPLSSHGISNAIFTASLACETINRPHQNPEVRALYAQRLTKTFYEYLQYRSYLYSMEKRWPTEFWENNVTQPLEP